MSVFFQSLWDWFLKPLEIAFRHAFYYPDTELKESFSQEGSLAVNWFFSGHRNKPTAKITYFDFRADPERE